MRDGLTYDRHRTFWQFVFPLDGVEERVRPLPGGGTETVRTEFTREYLAQLVSNHFERMAASSADGMPPQPVPLSKLHSIEAAIFGEDHAPLPFCSLTTRDLERLGGVLDLHMHEPPAEDADLPTPPVTVDAKPVPFGLWALCEWTGEGMWLAESGAFPCLSPTTGPWSPTASAEPFPGDSLIAIALVDVPALDTIGCASDRLPHDAFPSVAAPLPEPEWHDWPQMAFMSADRAQMAGAGAVVCRRGSYSLDAFAGVRARGVTDEETYDAGSEDAVSDSQTPDEGVQMEETIATMSDQLAGLVARMDALESRMAHEPEAPEQPEDAVDEEPETRSEATADAEPAGEPETAPDPVAAVTDEPAETIEARALRVEREALEADALALVKSRRILAGNVPAYIETRAKGEDASGFLGSFGAPEPQGVNVVTDADGVQTRSAQPDDGPKTVTLGELRTRALKEAGGNRVAASKITKRLRAEAQAEGITVLNTQGV